MFTGDMQKHQATALRVLVFADSTSTVAARIASSNQDVQIVDTIHNRDDAVRGAALPVDVVLMLADAAKPSTRFEETAKSLSVSRFDGKVVMMVAHPAGYLPLAIRAGAAALVTTQSDPGAVISLMREVREWASETPSFRETEPTEQRRLYPNREVTDM
jgi:hypothetical protein